MKKQDPSATELERVLFDSERVVHEFPASLIKKNPHASDCKEGCIEAHTIRVRVLTIGEIHDAWKAAARFIEKDPDDLRKDPDYADVVKACFMLADAVRHKDTDKDLPAFQNAKVILENFSRSELGVLLSIYNTCQNRDSTAFVESPISMETEDEIIELCQRHAGNDVMSNVLLASKPQAWVVEMLVRLALRIKLEEK